MIKIKKAKKFKIKILIMFFLNKEIRKNAPDYDSVIKVNNKIYVIDDLFKEYDELLNKIK